MAKVTNHAKRRMHSRIGITKGIAQKQALKVLRNGIKHEETLGNLHKWMDAEFLRYRTARVVSEVCEGYIEDLYDYYTIQRTSGGER